jgi:hypothetical protein
MSKRRKKVVLVPCKEEAQRDEEQAQRAKALQEKIRVAKKGIKAIQGRYPEKSLIQLLRRIRMELGPIATMITILRIERNQEDCLSLDDRAFLEEERAFLRQGNPQLETDLKEMSLSRL